MTILKERSGQKMNGQTDRCTNMALQRLMKG